MYGNFRERPGIVPVLAMLVFLTNIGRTPLNAQTDLRTLAVKLKHNWSYRWDNAQQAVDVIMKDSAGWKPLLKMDQPLNDRDQPDLFLRIRLPEEKWHDPALYLESLQISFDVHVNGVLIHSYRDSLSRLEGQLSGGQFHIIPLPHGSASQWLTIVVLDAPNNRTGLRKTIKVGSGSDLLLELVKKNLDQFILGFFFLFVGVFFLAVFFQNLQQNNFFSFGFFSFCTGIYVVIETSLMRLLFADIIAWRYFAELISLYLIPVGILIFIEHNMRSKLLIWLRRLWQLHIAYAAGVIVLVLAGLVSLYSTVAPFQAMVMVDIVMILVAAVREARKRDIRSKIFGGGIGGLVLFALYDNLGYLLIIPKGHNLFPWGVLIFMLFMGYILERRIAEAYVKRERERANLREIKLRAQAAQKELNVAAAIQKAILPKTLPMVDGFDIFGLNVPSREVSGDYFDGFVLPDGRLVMVIADVMGKGIPAALLVSTLHASLHAFMESHYALTELASRLNQLVYRSSTTETFITFFVGVFEPHTGSMDFINAGHNPPLLVRYDGSVERLRARGVALGVVSDIGFDQGHTQLRSGDRVLLYTDGVTEATNLQDELYAERRLVDHLIRHAHLTASSFAASLLTAIREFASGREPDDDVTLLYCRRL